MLPLHPIKHLNIKYLLRYTTLIIVGLLAIFSRDLDLYGAQTTIPNTNVSNFTAGTLTLYAGQSIRSNNGQHRLIMQSDGNLVLYHINRAKFNTGTQGSGAIRATFQSDGNLVVYNAVGQAKWNSRTAGSYQARLVIQDDGNLVIYSNSSLYQALWNSQSNYSGSTPFVNHLVTNNNAQTQIIQPVHPTADIVVADYNAVSDFGADNTGTTEASEAIQSALNQCANNGGGTVWLPHGKYIISHTIHIPPFCFLRGDWQDPDLVPLPSTDTSYGTLILATVANSNPNSNNGGISVFTLDSPGPAGLTGVTIFYPNQTINSVIPYGYSIVAQNGCSMAMIENITLINSYAGIVIGPDSRSGNWAHELGRIKNIKGTALAIGLTVNNSSDVDVFETIIFNNKYWCSSGSYYNPPSPQAVNTYTLASGTAFSFRDIEQCQFANITASNYSLGIVYNSASRIPSSCIFINANITLCHTALLCYPYSLDSRWGVSFAGGVLSGDVAAVSNFSSAAWVMGNQTNISGPTYGIIADGTTFPRSSSSNPIPSYPRTNPTTVARSSGTAFRDVSLPPYNVIRMAINYDGSIPTPDVDATPGIQAALSDVASLGGGVVYLPPGWYSIAGHLMIPTNVELRGAGTGPGHGGGTTLFAFEGENSPTRNTDPALITLNGNLAGISNLKIFYPGNNLFNQVPVCYPTSIRGNGSNVYIRNVNVTGATIGIDFHTNTCNQHYVENFFGWAVSAMIHAGNGTGIIRTVHSNGTAVNRATFGIQGWITTDEVRSFNSISQENQTFIFIEQPYIGTPANGEVITNVFAYGPRLGIYNQCPNTQVFNLGTDCLGPRGTQTGYNIVASQPTLVVNTSMTTGAGPTYGYAPYGIITYYNYMFVGQTGIDN